MAHHPQTSIVKKVCEFAHNLHKEQSVMGLMSPAIGHQQHSGASNGRALDKLMKFFWEGWGEGG